MSVFYKINHQINHSFITLISVDGINLGIYTKSNALFEAQKVGLDLVQIGDDKDKNPICKILDYGKMKYQESKKRKKHSVSITKEIWIGYNTGEHDIKIKNNHVLDFLDKKYKVFYAIKVENKDLRVANMNSLALKLENILDEFKEKATWIKPKITGKIVSTTLVPK